MAAIGRPVHGVNLCEVTLQRPARLHANSREGIGLVLRDLADCGEGGQQLIPIHRNLFAHYASPEKVVHQEKKNDIGFEDESGQSNGGKIVREVSASSSLRRLILSFKPSASRLAAVILACICSPVISAAILPN